MANALAEFYSRHKVGDIRNYREYIFSPELEDCIAIAILLHEHGVVLSIFKIYFIRSSSCRCTFSTIFVMIEVKYTSFGHHRKEPTYNI